MTNVAVLLSGHTFGHITPGYLLDVWAGQQIVCYEEKIQQNYIQLVKVVFMENSYHYH